MKYQLLSILLASSSLLFGQVAGSNTDPNPQQKGERPYEMQNRLSPRDSFNFMDCSKWVVESNSCDVNLYRSNEQIVTEDYSAKIVYKAKQNPASFTIKLKNPLAESTTWDCIDVWTYGAHWLWEADSSEAMEIFAIIQEPNQKVQEINMVQAGTTTLGHKYWFLNHLKLKEAMKPQTRFIGFKFIGNRAGIGKEKTLYLSSGYLYKETLPALSFTPFPEKLPFPNRPETILPTNKIATYQNNIELQKGTYTFSYKGSDATLSYHLNPDSILGNVNVYLNNQYQQTIANRQMIMENGEATSLRTLKVTLKNDTLFLQCKATYGKKQVPFTAWYTIKQKSLIFYLKENNKNGSVKELLTGQIEGKKLKTLPIPFLNFNYNERPHLLCNNRLFTFFMFDWNETNASKMEAESNTENVFKGTKVIYIPKTNGIRNPLLEKLFINVSPDVQEVFPTIPNPASPMRSLQADRLWTINGGAHLPTLQKYVTDLRSKGVEKVSIRYHEDIWRKDGESYTFKLTPNPEIGVEKLKSFIRFVKANDWRVGLYSNYTDLSPVNALWNPDWIKQGPNGEWEVSWARCYSPKPQIAWEQEAILAPQIHKLFNTNHSYCDVHTAISPMSRVDYDYRTPEAGMMKGIIKRYGMLLLNEKRVYNGPVYSEGNNHWWYAGLTDGNYANDNLLNLPVFPDFSLMKIHPLEMDAANTDKGYTYLAYALAYGNIGILAEGNEGVSRYAFLQPLQSEYVMIPIRKIEYFSNGKSYSSSEAIINNLLKAPQLYLEYESGLKVYVNFGQEDWVVNADNRSFTLPTHGFVAYLPDGSLQSSSTIIDGKRCDEVYSKDLYYLNTLQKREAPLGGDGNYLLKKEKFSWEIIPLQEGSEINFDLKLMGLENYEVNVISLDKEGEIMDAPIQSFTTRVCMQHQAGVYKYQVVPVANK